MCVLYYTLTLSLHFINFFDFSQHGWTALMLAAAQGHATSVRALLTRSDIDVNVQNTQVDYFTSFLVLVVVPFSFLHLSHQFMER